MQRRLIQATLAATVLALAGCGGGGGDSGSTTSFNAAAAFNNLYASNRSWNLTGTDNFGINYQIGLAHRPGTAGTYPVTGVPANRRFIDETVVANGVSFGTVSSTLFLDPATGTPIGTQSVASTDGSVSCSRFSATGAPPTAALVGDTGVLGTGFALDGCTSTAFQVGSATLNWSMLAESGITYFCISSTEVESGTRSVEEQCFEVATDGSIGTRARLSVLVTSPGTQELRLVARSV